MFKNLCVGIGLVVSLPLFPHPPTRVSIVHEPESHRMVVSVLHPVENTHRHFVDRMIIQLNGKEIITQSFLSQMDREKQETSYLVHDIKSGDRIEITARCNVFGKKTETYQVP